MVLLNNNLKGFEPILDSTGKITGYKTALGGADTVFPFSGNYTVVFKLTIDTHNYMTGDLDVVKSWNITAKISNGKCTFSPSGVSAEHCILTSDRGSATHNRTYLGWSITLISITAD